MFFKEIIPVNVRPRHIVRAKRPVVLKQKPIIIVQRGVTPDGNPFKQRFTQSGERYLSDGKPSGFSISKGMSFVSGPNMKIRAMPKHSKRRQLTLKNMINHLVTNQKGRKLVIKRKPGTKKKMLGNKRPVTSKKSVSKKKPVTKKKSVAKKKQSSKKKNYIVMNGKKKLIYKGDRGGEYYKSKGKKIYIPSIKN